jgi:hypothetical protein
MYRLVLFSLVIFSPVAVFAQQEAIDNATVINMSKSGLSAEIILKKIGSSRPAFDVSAASLIQLKNAGVDEGVISVMMERNDSASASGTTENGSTPTPTINGFSESGPQPVATSHEAVISAKTIAFGKSSVQPSRQALEKELLKRKDFQQLNLTILRYKENADLFVDIGFVSGSLVTHRYVYRIYDRRSGAVITAGETTSWGSLAENLARHIAKRLVAVRSNKTT